MRSLLALSLITLGSLPAAAQQPQVPPLLHTTGAFFAIAVPSASASRAWYERVPGLTVTRQLNE